MDKEKEKEKIAPRLTWDNPFKSENPMWKRKE